MQRNRSAFRLASATKLQLTMALVGTVFLSGCASDDRFQYTARSDKILNDSGNAVASNIIAQTVDPWSPYSRTSATETDGKRAKAAIERYQKDRVRAPAATGASNSGGSGVN